MQNPLKIIFPDQCAGCGGMVEGDAGLCAACWSETRFLQGLACDACAAPLLGPGEDAAILCDDCLLDPPPWRQGRAVAAYSGVGRKLVLSLKHGDRLDLVRPLARWMSAAGRDILTPGALLVPVPLHWTRLLRRRFNQSAALATAIARPLKLTSLPDALVRTRRSLPQERMTREERRANQADSIGANPQRIDALRGGRIVLVDDVITTGATARAATAALLAAGAAEVSVLAFARVVKDPA